MSFESQFSSLLQQYPDAVADKKRFVGLLKDYFPDQPMQVNLISLAYGLGIAEELRKTNHVTNAFAFRFVKRLLDEYGVSRINADWAVSVWCVCYGEQTLNKPCDIAVSKAKSGAAPAIRDEQGSGGRQYNDLFRFRAVADGYGISGFNGDDARTLIIPHSYNGKPVTRILAGVFEGCDVQEAVMTDGVAVIENGAFRDCKKLKQVIFPGTLKEIGDAAFSGCGSLNTAALPKGLEQIGRYAFSGTALKQVELPDNLLWLGEGAYRDCEKLLSVRLPQQLQELPPEIFKGCASLKKMTLPESVQTIGDEAFAGCSSLLDLIVPESVIKVGENAFFGMDASFRLICTQNSAAENYARKHNVPFQIV